ncbi:phage tail protein [Micromonospora soli]|uniref:phage tail protein n=1 Tax=Micromonospora sp. NBRC 110009 TaxID=3061627 RepID=UPI0026711511|nr:phage tail protein [Micromonospora sp. NBRC 110009]WKT96868.1 phage tail protein [Micromonospora sp. NBRC 110009]
MPADRGYRRISHPDQWSRCAHTSTALLDGGGIELSWQEPATTAGERVGDTPQGLAFDRWCRAYRSLPGQGRVAVLPDDLAQLPEPVFGEPCPGALSGPRGLAVDDGNRLYVAESGAGAVHVVDLRAQRLRARRFLRSRRHPRVRPIGIAAVGRGAVVLTADPVRLWRFEGRRGPLPGPVVHRPAGAKGLRCLHVTAGLGRVLLLWSGPGSAAVVADPAGTVEVRVDGATDLAIDHDGVLVVAGAPGGVFRRFRPGGAEIEPLGAPGYDGGAIAIAPNGRVAFTTADGFAWTSGPSLRYPLSGSVVTYRLDGGIPRTRWGRVFLDACLPRGTDLRLRLLTTDDDEVTDPIPARAPVRGGIPVLDPGATPPLPSQLGLRDASPSRPLYRRPTGPEEVGRPADDTDTFATYEAPVDAPPGRYLWLVLELTGTGLNTPRARAVRVERPGHRLLDALPRSWSRDPAGAAFLQRFLAPAEGLLSELDDRADARDLLLHPAAAPAQALPWLAGLLALSLDRRWPEAARRQLIAEAFGLFRLRGTGTVLARLLRIYLGREVQVVENWRMRGLGGTVLGGSPGGPPAPALAAEGSATAALGRFTVGGQPGAGGDGYTVTAHRFTVLVPGRLDPDRREVVAGLVERYKPAHTMAVICQLGDGMRVGRRMHVGLTTFVGPDAAWHPAIVGQVAVGADGVVGLPAVGSRVGDEAAIWAVRVG